MRKGRREKEGEGGRRREKEREEGRRREKEGEGAPVKAKTKKRGGG